MTPGRGVRLKNIMKLGTFADFFWRIGKFFDPALLWFFWDFKPPIERKRNMNFKWCCCTLLTCVKVCQVTTAILQPSLEVLSAKMWKLKLRTQVRMEYKNSQGKGWFFHDPFRGMHSLNTNLEGISEFFVRLYILETELLGTEILMIPCAETEVFGSVKNSAVGGA